MSPWMQTSLFAGLILFTASVPAQAQVGAGNKDLVNPNLATAEDLEKLPGVDEPLARSIIEQRPFLSVTALDKVLASKLDETKREVLYKKMFVPVNLNAASEAEILMIPGVGKKMAHEFEEYRPYKALAQFRREIGKYVDKHEVARLEKYVFIPLNLNSATEEEFKTIPGVGKKMVHEFMEYRPYKNIEQFRREIGKYVDKKEVARLERYVSL